MKGAQGSVAMKMHPFDDNVYLVSGGKGTGSVAPGAPGQYSFTDSSDAGLVAGSDWSLVKYFYIYKWDKNNVPIDTAQYCTSGRKIYFEVESKGPGTPSPEYCWFKIVTRVAYTNYIRLEISVPGINAGYIPGDGLVDIIFGAENRGDPGPTGPGCFIAGTQINTPKGKVAIEDIKDGDKVIAAEWTSENKIKYTEGTVYGKVSHTAEYIDKPILKISSGSDEFTCTPEHYLFRPDGSFKPAEEFKVGESLVLHPETIVEITKIENVPAETVYNFEVAPQRSYIANNFVVHNGGLGKIDAYEYTLSRRNEITYSTTNAR